MLANSDQHQFSSNNIDSMSKKKLGKENIKMLSKEKMLSPVIKFFQVIL